MPNLLTRNPIIITSRMTLGYKASVAATLGTLFTLQVTKIHWENAINTADFVRIIEPNSGEQLLSLYSVGPGSSYLTDWTSHPRSWSDFMVNQIDSGTLYIFTL